ncbi:MAG TPA: pyridoxal phosphate-dependent aminotransferase [archaeon]|nr:pyridoxal phosphate-dependent aminotransferase [archaeon]
MPLRQILSEREEELEKLEMQKLLRVATESKNIISLGPGEPDFGPPKQVVAELKRAVQKGYSRYSAVEGRKELLEQVAKKLRKENKISTDTENIVVTSGSNEAIMLSLMCVVDPGEQVMVPDPGYVTYIPTVELLNGQAISIPLLDRKNFEPTIESLKWLLKEPKRTRAIILNTPSNPTGRTYSRKVLEEIADFAVQHNLLVISDEAYEKFVYNKSKHISIGSFNGMQDYVVTVHSFSKTFGMPGFRVGYASGPKKVIDAMRKLHLYASICAPTISQIAATKALKVGTGFLKKIVKEYDRRRKLVVKRIKGIDSLSMVEPNGAFYAFVKYQNIHKSSLKLCRKILEEYKLALVPGSDFGRYGEGYFRISYATSRPLLEKGLDRLEKAFKKMK